MVESQKEKKAFTQQYSLTANDPVLIEDVPSSEDDFGFHDHLARQILNTVSDPRRSNCISGAIGLLGSWGSGKSTVVERLKARAGDTLTTFLFDSWIHRDEFLHRAFLLSLVKKLDIERKKPDDCWETEEGRRSDLCFKDKILNRVRYEEVKSSPSLEERDYVSILLIFFVSILTLVLSLFGAHLWALDEPFLISPKKMFATLAVIGFSVLALIGIRFIKMKSNPLRLIAEGIASLFVLRRSSIVDSRRSFEESDFTSYEFKYIMRAALETSECKTPLIIVLDNLDRVQKKYVLQVLSLIQTLLQLRRSICEKGEPFPFHIIVPIDPERLRDIFLGEQDDRENGTSDDWIDEHIQKLFQIRFELPCVGLSNWRDYLRKLLNRAFGERFSSHFELVEYAFLEHSGKFANVDHLHRNLVTPRELISYVNALVVNYDYWRDEIPFPLQVLYVTAERYDGHNDENGLASNIVRDDSLRAACPILTGYFTQFKHERIKHAFLQQKYKSDAVYELLYEGPLTKAVGGMDVDNFNMIRSRVPKSEFSKILRKSINIILGSLIESTVQLVLVSNFLDSESHLDSWGIDKMVSKMKSIHKRDLLELPVLEAEVEGFEKILNCEGMERVIEKLVLTNTRVIQELHDETRSSQDGGDKATEIENRIKGLFLLISKLKNRKAQSVRKSILDALTNITDPELLSLLLEHSGSVIEDTITKEMHLTFCSHLLETVILHEDEIGVLFKLNKGSLDYILRTLGFAPQAKETNERFFQAVEGFMAISKQEVRSQLLNHAYDASSPTSFYNLLYENEDLFQIWSNSILYLRKLLDKEEIESLLQCCVVPAISYLEPLSEKTMVSCLITFLAIASANDKFNLRMRSDTTKSRTFISLEVVEGFMKEDIDVSLLLSELNMNSKYIDVERVLNILTALASGLDEDQAQLLISALLGVCRIFSRGVGYPAEVRQV